MRAKYIVRLTVTDTLRRKHLTIPTEYEVSEEDFRRIQMMAAKGQKTIRCGDVELRRFWGGF